MLSINGYNSTFIFLFVSIQYVISGGLRGGKKYFFFYYECCVKYYCVLLVRIFLRDIIPLTEVKFGGIINGKVCISDAIVALTIVCFLYVVSEVVQTLQLCADRDESDVVGDLSVCLDGMTVDPDMFAKAEADHHSESRKSTKRNLHWKHVKFFILCCHFFVLFYRTFVFLFLFCFLQLFFLN